MTIEEECNVFCENVKYLRNKLQLSKKDMARLLGIGVKSLAKLEAGIIPPRLSATVVWNLSCSLGLRPHQLFSPLDPDRSVDSYLNTD